MGKNYWENRIVGSGELDPKDILPNSKNIRKHPKNQRNSLKSSLDEVGFVAPVTINQRTGLLIDGHMRVEEALIKGVASIPVCYVDLTETEEKYVLLTLDPIGSLARYDNEQTADLLNSVGLDDKDLVSTLGKQADDSHGQLKNVNIPNMNMVCEYCGK